MENKFKSLDKKILKVWLIVGGICFLPFLCVLVILALLIDPQYLVPTLISGIIVLILLGLLCFGYPVLKYHYYSYYYNERRICINKGVIFRTKIVIPVCQIQDLHLYQGPIMLLLKLSGVEISTAGSNYVINGISNEDASKMIKDLEEDLYQRIKESLDE